MILYSMTRVASLWLLSMVRGMNTASYHKVAVTIINTKTIKLEQSMATQTVAQIAWFLGKTDVLKKVRHSLKKLDIQ